MAVRDDERDAVPVTVAACVAATDLLGVGLSERVADIVRVFVALDVRTGVAEDDLELLGLAEVDAVLDRLGVPVFENDEVWEPVFVAVAASVGSDVPVFDGVPLFVTVLDRVAVRVWLPVPLALGVVVAVGLLDGPAVRVPVEDLLSLGGALWVRVGLAEPDTDGELLTLGVFDLEEWRLMVAVLDVEGGAVSVALPLRVGGMVWVSDCVFVGSGEVVAMGELGPLLSEGAADGVPVDALVAVAGAVGCDVPVGGNVMDDDALGVGVGAKNVMTAELVKAVVIGDHSVHMAESGNAVAENAGGCTYATRAGVPLLSTCDTGAITHSDLASKKKRASDSSSERYTGVGAPDDVFLAPMYCHDGSRAATELVLPSTGGGTQPPSAVARYPAGQAHDAPLASATMNGPQRAHPAALA